MSSDIAVIPKLIHALRNDITLYNFGSSTDEKQNSIDSMSTLLERIELLVRCESEKASNLVAVSMNSVAQKSLEKLSKSEKQRVIYSPSDAIAFADTVLMTAVVDEMLSNALRYSKQQVYLSVHRTKGHAVVRLEDFGGGIPRTVQSRIAEPFVTSDDKSGHGLGLAIMRAIAQAHDGGLTLITDEGQGTTVLFSLDLV